MFLSNILILFKFFFYNFEYGVKFIIKIVCNFLIYVFDLSINILINGYINYVKIMWILWYLYEKVLFKVRNIKI